MKTSLKNKDSFTRSLDVTVPWASLKDDFARDDGQLVCPLDFKLPYAQNYFLQYPQLKHERTLKENNFDSSSVN